jgi:hypothetical protein
VIANLGLNINNIGPAVQGRRIENSNYGTLQEEKREAPQGHGASDIDVGALLNGIGNILGQAQEGQAHKPASGLDQIIGGLQENGQTELASTVTAGPPAESKTTSQEPALAPASVHPASQNATVSFELLNTQKSTQTSTEIAAAVTVIAGGAPAPEIGVAASSLSSPASLNSTTLTTDGLIATSAVATAGPAVIVQAGSGGNDTITAISSGTLTRDGLVAATTTSAAGSAVGVIAGGETNAPVAATSTASVLVGGGASEQHAAASTVAVIAGGVATGHPAATEVSSGTSMKAGLIATTSIPAPGTAIAVSAGENLQAGAQAESSAPPAASINSATLTKDGLIATTSIPGPGSTVTVKAGGEQAAGASASSGPASINSVTLAHDGLVGATSTTAAGSPIAVSAGGPPAANVQQAPSLSSAPPSIDSATLTKDDLIATVSVSAPGPAVTVLAGGDVSNVTAQAVGESTCNQCVCKCGIGAFPMNPPHAQPFQLQTMSMGSMPAAAAVGSTLSTVASVVTVVAGGSGVSNQAQAESTSAPPPIDSATLTTTNLIATTAMDALPPAITVVMSGSEMTAVPTSSSILTSLPPKVEASIVPFSSAPPIAQSQVAGPSVPTPVSSQTEQPIVLPFDISTVVLQSKITVNLGRRAARATVR